MQLLCITVDTTWLWRSAVCSAWQSGCVPGPVEDGISQSDTATSSPELTSTPTYTWLPRVELLPTFNKRPSHLTSPECCHCTAAAALQLGEKKTKTDTICNMLIDFSNSQLILLPFNSHLPGDPGSASYSSILLLHLFRNRTSGMRVFYWPNVLPATQPSVSYNWRKYKPLTLTSGQASSFLHQQLDSSCSFYAGSLNSFITWLKA